MENQLIDTKNSCFYGMSFNKQQLTTKYKIEKLPKFIVFILLFMHLSNVLVKTLLNN